jgi:hypothetical protein
MSAGGGRGFGAALRAVRALDFLTLRFPLAFDDAGCEGGLAGAASPFSVNAATHNPRRLARVIGRLTLGPQVELDLPSLILCKSFSLHE